jgi:hypothetical protein
VVAKSARQVVRPALGIGIDDGMSQRIVTLHSDFGECRRREDSIPSRFEFVCRMSGLVFRPGDYRVKLSLEGNGQALHVLDEALIFTILPTDYYRNGGKFGRGLVLCDQEWDIRTPN